MLKILGIPDSYSEKSINALLVRYVIDSMKSNLNFDAEYSILDLNNFEMPIYKAEREAADGVPERAIAFVRAIEFSDALIFSFAEHNGNYSAAFKIVFDWASRIDLKVFHGRPILMMATSPGARGGAAVLQIASNAAPYFEGKVFATFSLPRFNETFDRTRNIITDEDKAYELFKLIEGFTEEIAKNRRTSSQAISDR